MNEHKKEKQRSSNYPQGFAVGYLYATTVQTINHLIDTSSEPLSHDELAAGLGSLLLSKAGGKVLGPSDSVRPVRRKATKRSKAVAKVAVDDTARYRPRLTFAEETRIMKLRNRGWTVTEIRQKTGRSDSAINKVISNSKKQPQAITKKKQRKKHSYNGTHWTQQPEGRARMKKIQEDRHSDDVSIVA